MYQREDKRIFSFFEIKLDARCKGRQQPAYNLTVYLNALKKSVSNNIEHPANSGRQIFKIQSFEEDASKCTILLKCTDKTIRDQTLQNTTNTSSRDIVKQEGEGFSFTSHMVLFKNSSKLIIEENTGFTASAIERSLNKIITKYYKIHEKIIIKRNDPSGEIRQGIRTTITVLPIIELRGIASAEFHDALNNSKIAGIELITQNRVAQSIETNENIDEVKTAIGFKLSKNVSPGKSILNILKDFLKKNSGQFEKALIRYKPENENMHSAQCSTDTFQLINSDKLVKRIETIGWGRIKHSYDSIQPEVVKKILEIADD